MKHTPGPWAILDLEKIKRIYVAGGNIICDVRGDEQQANARLIAAAPDLFEALELFILLKDGKPSSERFEKGSAAIAKAKGE